jgi:hypothetical protein
MLIIYIPLYVDTATVASSRHVTPNGSLSEQGISLSNVIETRRPCHGISHHNGVLLWFENQRGIQMMKLSDDRVTTLGKQINLPYNSYLTTCGDNRVFPYRMYRLH